jgi:hypothetical protein
VSERVFARIFQKASEEADFVLSNVADDSFQFKPKHKSNAYGNEQSNG